ncbi:MAG: hypothetical protein EZS28_003306 [Streblomastix strix]|uniref:RRM domain-containing protein n=1 Tax=Streblomastix strix TaxID=222440 RepID=A0A5J4X3E7_9EUKA|nr:MAG: hypothetical protein EZS28_003306 [Streblomastix strix]
MHSIIPIAFRKKKLKDGVYIGDLVEELSEEEIVQAFNKFGQYGFIWFYKVEDRNTVLSQCSKDGIMVRGHRLSVSVAEQKKTLLITNIPPNGTKLQLSDYLLNFGQLVSLEYESGQSQAIVKYQQHDDAEMARTTAIKDQFKQYGNVVKVYVCPVCTEEEIEDPLLKTGMVYYEKRKQGEEVQ